LRQQHSGLVGGALVSNNITPQSTFILNGRFNAAGAGNNIYTLYDNASPQCSLVMNGDAKLVFHRGSGYFAQIGIPSAQALVIDAQLTFYDLEAKFVIGNSGSVELRINGGVQIGPTTGDTQATGSNTANSMALSALISGSQSCNHTWDHFIVLDGSGAAANDFIGAVDVTLLQPTGDGFYTAWSVTGVANRWDAVNDPDPDGDTTYISASVVGDKNTFTHGNLPAASTAVKVAAVWARAKRDDGVTRAFKVLLRNATPTDNLGSIEHFAGDNYIWFFQPYEINPFTSAAWTVSEINAVEYGVQVTT
jgi:hypothetical protein